MSPSRCWPPGRSMPAAPATRCWSRRRQRTDRRTGSALAPGARDGLLGRAFGLRDSLGNLAFVLAFVSAGAVLSVLGVRALFALGGVSLIALTLTPWLRFRPEGAGDALPAFVEPA